MEKDNADELPIGEVGEWAKEKHARLRKYIDISRAVRRKFAHSTYIDPFCGLGRDRVRGTADIIDGSSLVAWKAALASSVPFTELHLGDIEAERSAASATRVAKLDGRVVAYTGPAEKTVGEIVSKLDPYGLHFAFLDPYNLAGLSFEVIKTLSRLKRIDLLMHVSIQDMQRNSDRYMSEDMTQFDTFAPNWRSSVNLNQNLGAVRAAVMNYWRKIVCELGFMDMRSVELIRGGGNQKLYWLAFASKEKIANDFWDKIRTTSGQGELDL